MTIDKPSKPIQPARLDQTMLLPCLQVLLRHHMTLNWPPKLFVLFSCLLDQFTANTEQGHCGACRRKWRLTDTDLCPCGETSHCRILSPDKTKWRLISATLCGWGCCFMADQLWFMKRVREEEDSKTVSFVFKILWFTSLIMDKRINELMERSITLCLRPV